MKKLPNYYKILQVDSSADADVIQSAYRKLASKYHPDNNTSEDATRKMQELNEAKEVLLDSKKRREYDVLFREYHDDNSNTQKTNSTNSSQRTDPKQRPEFKVNKGKSNDFVPLDKKTIASVSGILIFILILAFAIPKLNTRSHSPIESTTPNPTLAQIPAPSPTALPCHAIPSEPTPVPGANSLFPAVRADEWAKGPADAPTTIVIYNDFQCIECNDRVLNVLAEMHPKDVRLVYRHYPQVDRYDKSYLAAQASEAAGAQGRFWDMHDILFAKQSEWIDLTPEEFKPWVINEAERFGMDRARFEADFNNPATLAKVQKAEADAKTAGIPVLPLVLINGEIYYGPTDYSAFDQVVRLMKLGGLQYSDCPQVTIDLSKQYLATIKTEKGDIVIELYADKAPLTVNSFVFLARHGWYNGVTFHRVIPDFVAQTGDPSGTGVGGPGYLFRDELNPSLHFDKPGVVGMANSGPDTNGSQFFITYSAQPGLDGRFTIFGYVISGMDVLKNLTPRDPSEGPTIVEGDPIISITIEER
jgi:cyclophilin family peptidyl-prolyl cis-trans isomerase/protein-disulfide isomerase